MRPMGVARSSGADTNAEWSASSVCVVVNGNWRWSHCWSETLSTHDSYGWWGSARERPEWLR